MKNSTTMIARVPTAAARVLMVIARTHCWTIVTSRAPYREAARVIPSPRRVLAFAGLRFEVDRRDAASAANMLAMSML